MTRVLAIHSQEPGFDRVIAEAVKVLREGGLVAYPTDTLYGLGARALLPDAVERVFAAKGRAASRGIPVLIARTEDLVRVAGPVPEMAWRLAARFWPGPLTLVLPRRSEAPTALGGDGPNVAVRVPDHLVPLALIEMLGEPITGTSANRTGAAGPVTAADVLAELDGTIELLLDGGPCPGGVGSTVLDLTGEPPVVLRQGGVGSEALEAVMNCQVVTTGASRVATQGYAP